MLDELRGHFRAKRVDRFAPRAHPVRRVRGKLAFTQRAGPTHDSVARHLRIDHPIAGKNIPPHGGGQNHAGIAMLKDQAIAGRPIRASESRQGSRVMLDKNVHGGDPGEAAAVCGPRYSQRLVQVSYTMISASIGNLAANRSHNHPASISLVGFSRPGTSFRQW